ncbi:Sorbitol-6-phosphate 2-dehydrogenase [Candidatus Rhodobacter oscarellae]|uniref:Sorbitol-6-phosphate 2-dehydrogenase n=1 Tax=Candidatus Rhodobacter oscarellae TaxID=1675527 RepID=A0A0J9E301_9RHOB|nr:class II aldolase/adducin family protein [Candidatus Rhodobacter lobularis]KMW56159.1 Sorbitol-6-phosphate 2-dehydrogenase [Candidatus Rhodobacter lobularis]
MTEDLETPGDLADLAQLSVRVGSDPLLIQAAGGNTSVKSGDVMWIKASGTLLAEAGTKEIFVPVDLPAMRAALDDATADADQTAQFILGGATLRPSIETSLHAVFSQRVVVHVHCVNTLAHVIRRDKKVVLEERLAEFDWCLVPYTKPGAKLAELVRHAMRPGTDVVLLGNHGLIVAGDTVAEAEDLLNRVVTALKVAPAAMGAVDMATLESLATSGWCVPEASASVHQLALDPARMNQASGGSLYPDHVIFCGIGATVLKDDLPDPSDAPVFLLVPGKGAVMRADASNGAQALMNCLGDVLVRVPPEAELNYLTLEQNAELLDWDAEKYRQRLNA